MDDDPKPNPAASGFKAESAGQPARSAAALAEGADPASHTVIPPEQREEWLQQAAQMAKLGFYLWDARKDRCIFCSEEHARIHGMTPDEYVAQASTMDGLTHPEDVEKVRAAFTGLREGRDFELEYRIVIPGGEVRYVRENGRPIFDADGNVVRELGTCQDVTDRVLLEDKLSQARKLEALGQLTGGVAHDFNNLLAVIQVSAELLINDGNSNDKLVKTILDATRNGGELTKRLLAFSRRQPLRPRTINPMEFVLGMTDMLRRTVGEDFEVRANTPDDLWCCSADPGQLEDAILNLVFNSRDAMPRGGLISVDCGNRRLRQKDRFRDIDGETIAGDFVEVSVSDRGLGMTDEERDRAIEPFFTTKDVGKGSGLGLSMVYGFVKQTKGHLLIESEPESGTTVSMLLPKSDELPETIEPETVNACPPGRGETILVLEDDRTLQTIVAAMLRSLKYEIKTADHADAARKLVAEGAHFDLLLSDVMLPGGTNGPEFARELAESRPGIPIIFMSGYSREVAENSGILGEHRILLTKPFKIERLAVALRDMLDHP